MYSRDFGGIKSEGQLYNMEREYEHMQREEPRYAEVENADPPPRKKGFGLDSLRNLKLDDLLLLGIGLLLLLDSDEDNDIMLLIVAFLLFF